MVIPSSPPTTKPYFLIAVTFLLVEATSAFETIMMYMSLPTLIRELQVGMSTISWAITIFLLVGAATVSLSGRLGDLYGRKRVLVVLLAIAAVGPVISAVMGSLEGIMIGRALQGASVALFPLLAAMAREVVPPARVPSLISITAGSAALFASVGMFVSGALLDHFSWVALFYASAVLAVISLGAAIVFLPNHPPAVSDEARTDILGAVLPLPAIAALLYGVDSIGDADAAVVVALIGGGLVVGAFWVRLELKLEHPMFNLRLFKDRSLALVLTTAALLGGGLFAASNLMAPLLQQTPSDFPVGLGLTPTQAGLIALCTGTVGFAFAPVAGRIAARSGAKNSLLIGAAFGLAGAAGLMVGVHSLPLSVVSMLAIGVATTFMLSGITNLIVEVVPPENTGEAVGMVYGTARAVFTAVGTVVVSALLGLHTVGDTNAPERLSWTAAGVWLVVTLVAAAVSVFFIRARTSKSDLGDTQSSIRTADADAVYPKTMDVAQ